MLESDGTINISQSKVKTWRDCRRAYHYKFVEMLKKRKVKRPFTFGRIVHEMVEAYAEGDDPFAKLDEVDLTHGKYFRSEVEMYGNIIEDIRLIMTEYFEYWGDQLIYIRKNKRSSEHEFRIELEPGLWFTGRIDGVGRAKKMRWVVEHKTFSRMPSEDDRWRSVQAGVYFRALEMMGWPPFDGVLWDYVSSKPPAVPEFTEKTGKVSEKRINTLPSAVNQWLAENKLKARDYPKLMDMANENRANYFIRVFNPVKPMVVQSLWDDFLETAREIKALHGVSKARTIGRHCTWCDYELICRGEMQGLDVDFILEREYVRTDKDDGENRADDAE